MLQIQLFGREFNRRQALLRICAACVSLGAFALVSVGLFDSSFGQNIQIATPTTRISDSFYERMGVGWNFSFGGPSTHIFGSFNQGSADGAIPPFGGYDPNADATFGFNGRNGNGGGFSLGFRMGKGSSRTMTSASPSVVVPNGGVGSIFDGSLRPFVTGLIPVVGEPGDIVEPYDPPYRVPPAGAKSWGDLLAGEPESPPFRSTAGVSASTEVRDSSAARGDLSLAEIRRERELKLVSQQKEVEDLLGQATEAEAAGKYARARSLYRKAIKQTDGRQQYDLKVKLESIRDK